MPLPRDAGRDAGSVPHRQDNGTKSLPDALLSSRLKVCFSPCGNVHMSPEPKGHDAKFWASGVGAAGGIGVQMAEAPGRAFGKRSFRSRLASPPVFLSHSSPQTSVPVSDERTRSFLDASDNTSHIFHQGRGRSSAPSVKELSALYLSQTVAAVAHTGSPAQPVSIACHRPPPRKSPAASQQCHATASGCKRVRENVSAFVKEKRNTD